MRHGRFSQSPAELLAQISESVSYDQRLFREDIAGSLAHARAQLNAKILSPEEFAAIEQGLKSIQEDIENGKFHWDTALEDLHMNIEQELSNRIGATGGKLHTARSRNDQVATDVRLWCRSAIDSLVEELTELMQVLLQQASTHAATVLPGYTHLQRGQPVTVGHHLLAYVEMLGRDAERLQQIRARVNVSPLGSGALAGSTINLDRNAIAAELGFASITHNSMDAIADRDFIHEILSATNLCGLHLSRLSEDLILWTSAEFGFARLGDAHTTGSSLMPQKKNSDICELTRGKSGRLTGNLVALITAVKGLPLTYNRDLQEDKEPLFDSVDTLSLLLRVNADMLKELTIFPEACLAAAADPLLLATDLADWLVLKGVPFRQAHDIVGKAVACAEQSKTALNKLPQASVLPLSETFADESWRLVFDLEKALQARTNTGAPNPKLVQQEVTHWQNKLQN